MTWFIASLFLSLFIAVRSDYNRRVKLDGLSLNFWSSGLMVVLLLPLTLIWSWPQEPLFYGVAAGVALSVVIVNTVKFNLAAQHNGRVANMEVPLKAFILFGFWLVIDGSYLDRLVDSPLRTMGVLVAMVGAAVATMGMRRCDVGVKILMLILPIALISALFDGISKIALDPYVDHMIATSLIFVMLTSCGSTLLSGVALWRRAGQVSGVLRCNRKMLIGSFWVALLTIAMCLCFYVALILAPNPAYVTVIGMLTPVWLLVYHRLCRIPDEASPVMSTLLVISAVCLVLATSL